MYTTQYTILCKRPVKTIFKLSKIITNLGRKLRWMFHPRMLKKHDKNNSTLSQDDNKDTFKGIDKH